MGNDVEEPPSLLQLLQKDLAELDRKRALCEAEIRRQQPDGKSDIWLEYADLFDAALAMGEQFGTGFPTIDRATEGGLARGTVTVVQGKPGAGKTLVATQIARALAPHCAVAALFADEGLAGARIRIGQQLGLERLRMRRPEQVDREAASARLTSQAAFWRFLQPRNPRATIETLAAEFDLMAPAGLPRVWLLDSAQVIKSDATSQSTDRRLKTSDLIWRIAELTDKYRAITLLISQVGRGAYRSKKADERVEDLAAGLETSAIEYAAQLVLHIDGDPKDQVNVRCPKNRYTGDLFNVACRVDFPTATFHELDQASVEEETVLKHRRATSTIAQRVMDEIKKNPEGLTKRQLRDMVSARPSAINDAIDLLYQEKKIFNETRVGKGGGVTWRTCA